MADDRTGRHYSLSCEKSVPNTFRSRETLNCSTSDESFYVDSVLVADVIKAGLMILFLCFIERFINNLIISNMLNHCRCEDLKHVCSSVLLLFVVVFFFQIFAILTVLGFDIDICWFELVNDVLVLVLP